MATPRKRSGPIRLPGFVNDEDIGLGDVVSKATTAVRIRPCRGCARRARALNRAIVFRGRQTGRRA